MSSESESSGGIENARLAAMRKRAIEHGLLDEGGKRNTTLNEVECGRQIEALMEDIAAISDTHQGFVLGILSSVLGCSAADIARMRSAHQTELLKTAKIEGGSPAEENALEDATIQGINDPTKTFMARLERLADMRETARELRKQPDAATKILRMVILRLLKNQPIRWAAMQQECEELFLPERKTHASKAHDRALRVCIRNKWIVDEELQEVAAYGQNARDIMAGTFMLQIDPSRESQLDSYLNTIRQQLDEDDPLSIEFIGGVMQLLFFARLRAGEPVDEASLRAAASHPVALGVYVGLSDTAQLKPNQVDEWLNEQYWHFLIKQIGASGLCDTFPATPPPDVS